MRLGQFTAHTAVKFKLSRQHCLRNVLVQFLLELSTKKDQQFTQVNNMIEIYGKTQCPYCVQAKQLCETRKFNYEYKELGKDFDREQVLEWFPGARTFPQIKINGKSVGGYNEFVKYIDDTGYTGTGHTL